MPKRSRSESPDVSPYRHNEAITAISEGYDDKSNKKAYDKRERGSTPTRFSGSHQPAAWRDMTRERVEDLFAHELVDRRVSSQNLVHDAFGDLISPRLARQLIKGLLTRHLLKVQRNGGGEEGSEDLNQLYEDASNEAMNHAEAARKGENRRREEFVWSWDTGSCNTEEEGSKFLNTVVVTCMGVLAAGECDDCDHLKARLGSSCRFARNPTVHYGLPLSDPIEKQDTRPNILNLARSAFTVQKDQLRLDDFIDRAEEVKNSHSYCYLSPEPPVEALEPGPSTAKRARTDQTTTEKNAFREWLGEDKIMTQLDLAYVNCTQNRVAIEIKYANIDDGIHAAHIYMRGLRKAQPWLYRTLGLAMTDETLCLLRGDPSGIEECTFGRCSSRGVLDVVRIALGMTLANDAEFGIDRAFELREKRWKYRLREGEGSPDITADQPVPKVSGSEGGGKQAGRRIFKPQPHQNGYKTTSPLEERGTEYCLRFPVAVNLGKNKEVRRFLIYYLLHDAGLLAGRTTRVWCVAEDSDGLEEEDGYEDVDDKVVKVPERCSALKLSWPDVQRAQEVQKVLGVVGRGIKNLVLPPEEDQWNGQRVLEVRRILPPLHEADIEDRVQQWRLTPLMRPLCQFKNLDEVVDALIGFLTILIDLDAKKVLLRDVSDANILLRPDGSGALSDLDMAAFKAAQPPVVRVPLAEQVKFNKKGTASTMGPPAFTGKVLRTGTPAYMSVNVLEGNTHVLGNDVESVFYVLFLFFFTYNGPSPTSFPNKPEPQIQQWPDSIKHWAVGASFKEMSERKSEFFSDDRNLGRALVELPPYWDQVEVSELIQCAYDQVWVETDENSLKRQANTKLTPQMLQEALRSWKGMRGAAVPS